jgi:hypothetical protein
MTLLSVAPMAVVSAQPALSTLDQVCKIRDREASAGIALALLRSSVIADAWLDEASRRLRQARMYCRRQWVSNARVEYDALRRAFPARDEHIHALFEAEQLLDATLSERRTSDTAFDYGRKTQ